MEQSGRGQPRVEIQILFRGHSHDSQDGREATVVLSRWSGKLALQTHQICPPGCLGQSTKKLSDGSAGKGCWPLGAADCPAPDLDMEAAHAAEAGSWRSCRNLPRVAHENQEGKCLAPAKVLNGPLVLRLSVTPAGKEETCKGLRSIPTEQAVKGISGTKRQKLITGTTLFFLWQGQHFPTKVML